MRKRIFLLVNLIDTIIIVLYEQKLGHYKHYKHSIICVKLFCFKTH